MRYRGGATAVTAVAVGVGGVLVAGIGVGLAASHQGSIDGCVAKAGGAFRIVRTTRSCTSHERPLSFNAAGRRGPRGLPGAQGPRGVPASTSTTFQMYANVDSHGDLGSNVGATSAEAFNGVYIVTFAKAIDHCAMVAQPGEAGGTDTAHADTSVVIPNDLGMNPDPVHQVIVSFTEASGAADSTPFMLTVTCGR